MIEFLTLCFLISLFFINIREVDDRPIPTEFVNKKKDRKKFKQGRKDWMNNMHRSDSETDWKLMNRNYRKDKTIRINDLRKQIFLKGWTDSNEYIEVIGNREITGVWNEKGSNNLAGRIHTAEIDFSNSMIYCGSSGGNIWKGTLEGEDWVSLNDHMQIKDIKMIRIKDFIDFRRLLICGGKSFYYTDNEGVTIDESQGLETLDDWGNTIRSIIKDDVIYLLTNEWDYQNWNAACAIYKSIDNGQSFQRIIMFNDNSGYDIWTSRYEDTPIYIMNNSQISILNEEDELDFIGNIMTFENGDNMLTGGYDNGVYLYAKVGDRIYFSNNGGIDWLDKGSQPQWTFMINSFNSSNINPNLVGIGGMELFISNNSGSAWNVVNS